MASLLLQFSVTAAAAFEESVTSEWVPELEIGASGAVSGCPCLSNDSSIFQSIQFLQGGIPMASRCAAWDTGVNSLWGQRLASEGIPRWCEAEWCYVNATNCNRRSAASKLVHGVDYSYETCGFVDYFKTAVKPWNDSRPIYAFAFGHQASLESDAGSKVLNRHLSFAYRVLLQAGIQSHDIVYRRDVSETSFRQVGNPWSGCVLDVAVGQIDICFGDVWETPERQSFGAASFVQVSQANFFIIGQALHEEESLYDVLAKPFQPFDRDVWLLLAGTIFVVGIAMLLFEFHIEDGDFQGHGLFISILKSLYLAFLSFVNGGGSFVAVTASGRILSIGFGMFVMVSVAAFTASTADFLISASMHRQLDSLQRVLQDGSYKICYPVTLRDQLLITYPDMQDLGVPLIFPLPEDIVAAINQGTCQYGVMEKPGMDAMWSNGEMCDLEFIGESILSNAVGYFVTEELRPLISWAVVVLRTKGFFAQLEAKYRDRTSCSTERRLGVQSNFVTRRLKSSAASVSSRDGGPEPLAANHMFGACLVVAISIALAAIVRLGQVSWRGMGQAEKELAKETKAIGREVSNHVFEVAHSKATQAPNESCPERANRIESTTLVKSSFRQRV